MPATFEMATELIRPGGTVANVGVHGKSVELELQDLWIKDVTITTGLVSATTTPMLLRLVAQGKLAAGKVRQPSLHVRRHRRRLRHLRPGRGNQGTQGGHHPLTDSRTNAADRIGVGGGQPLSPTRATGSITGFRIPWCGEVRT